MNKIIIPAIVVIVAIVVSGLVFVSESTESSTYVYVPSDISKANPDVKVAAGSASLDTYDPADVKDRITNTVIGFVLSVGDPIDWVNENDRTHAAVPVTLKVTENIKGEIDKKVTFYLHGKYFSDQLLLVPYEAQFEIGEQVLVHLYPASEFEFQDGEALYPILGENGKYKIGEDNKVYNKNYPNGKSLDSAKNESK